MFDRREETRIFLQSLRSGRAAAFRSEVVPYFRYVAQSGFGLAVSALLFALIIGYANLLRGVPADFPAGYAGAAAIAVAAMRAPLRTYLKAADPVFLLPMETAVFREYIRPALMASMGSGMFRTLAVYVVFLPLYILAPATEAAALSRPAWLLGILFGALGAWNAYGAWRERQMPEILKRRFLKGGRYLATLLSAGGLLLGAPLPALALSSGWVLLISACWRFPQKQLVPWDKLISEESATMLRWYRFLGWFVDVPSAESRPARRRWAALFGERLPWDRREAWHYLYAKTFARGETAGALLRWYAVAGLSVLAADNLAVDWIAFGIGCGVGGIQLTELAVLRLVPSGETLPIGREGRGMAAAAVARTAGSVFTVILWLMTVIPQGWPPSWIAFPALAAGWLWNAWLVPRRISRSRDEDDD